MSTIPRSRRQADAGPSTPTSSSRLAEGEPVPKRRRTEHGPVPAIHIRPAQEAEVVNHVPVEQEPTVVSPLIVDLTASPGPQDDDEVVLVSEREGQRRNAQSRLTPAAEVALRAEARRLRHQFNLVRARALAAARTRNPTAPAQRAASPIELLSPAVVIAAQAAEIAAALTDDGGHARVNAPTRNRDPMRMLQPMQVSFRNGNMMFRFQVAQPQNAAPIDPATVHVPAHLRDGEPEQEPAAVVDESTPAVAAAAAETATAEEGSSHKCPICLDGIKRMVSTPCGHVFCCNCLLAALQTRKQCPKCRKACDPKRVHRIFLE